MTLKDIRERTNQSQVTVAKELGWARTKYNKWENNNIRSFTIADIIQLADYFHVSKEDILKGINVL